MNAPTKNKLRARGIALEQFRAAKQALSCAVADVLANRSIRCAPRCPGWFIDQESETPRLTRCDECALLSGYDKEIDDHDLIYLPAAQKALQRAFAENRDP